MCQLMLSNLHNSEFNKLAITTMIRFGASENNRHGTGIFMLTDKSKFTFWKTEVSGDALLNLGKVTSSMIKENKNPVMAHVRDASKGIAVTEENAHPFVGKRFSLAHNGRFWPDEHDPKDTTESDSKKFLEKLEELAEKNPESSVLELCNKTMEKFSGKFALLFIDKKYNKYYVARGSTAELHKLKVYGDLEEVVDEKGESNYIGKDQVGYLVMTKKSSLEQAGDILAQTLQNYWK